MCQPYTSKHFLRGLWLLLSQDVPFLQSPSYVNVTCTPSSHLKSTNNEVHWGVHSYVCGEPRLFKCAECVAYSPWSWLQKVQQDTAEATRYERKEAKIAFMDDNVRHTAKILDRVRFHRHTSSTLSQLHHWYYQQIGKSESWSHLKHLLNRIKKNWWKLYTKA